MESLLLTSQRRHNVTKREFLKENRKEINDEIRSTGYSDRINDEDREDWISNNEGWYNYARSCGVRI